MNESIILIVDDLMFLPKLETTLKRLNYQPLMATDETNLYQALFQSPVLIIVDLFSQAFDWAALIRFAKGAKGSHVPVLGFGPHVDLDLRERALAAGCQAVVGRGAISSRLPSLIARHKWSIDEQRCLDEPPAQLLKGIELFNEGAYFEAHEEIEHVWLAESHSVRVMYQGILQIAVACYHIESQNWRGAMKMLTRGLPKIKQFAPRCMGLDLGQLLEDAQAIQTELLRLGESWSDQFSRQLFPKIRQV